MNLGGWYSGDAFQNALFLNPGSGNRWLTVRLVGRRANRSGLGARIRVRVREDDRERDIYVLVGTGGSFGSNSIQAEIGLGSASAIAELEIRWPGSETVQVLEDVPLDTIVVVTEGEGLEVVTPEVISFDGARASTHEHHDR